MFFYVCASYGISPVLIFFFFEQVISPVLIVFYVCVSYISIFNCFFMFVQVISPVLIVFIYF